MTPNRKNQWWTIVLANRKGWITIELGAHFLPCVSLIFFIYLPRSQQKNVLPEN